MNIGIDHGYYAIKTRHCSFPAGITAYGSQEPYTRRNLLEFGGNFYLCGTGRQPLQKDKTQTDSYYLLTLAAIAQELKARCAPPECSITIAAGLPLTSFGRDKEKFTAYLLRPPQPVVFRYEDTEYRVTIEDVRLFPQGYAAVLTEPDLVVDEPSLLAMDIGGWTVDLMRIDNGVPNADTCHSLLPGQWLFLRCFTLSDALDQHEDAECSQQTKDHIQNNNRGLPPRANLHDLVIGGNAVHRVAVAHRVDDPLILQRNSLTLAAFSFLQTLHTRPAKLQGPGWKEFGQPEELSATRASHARYWYSPRFRSWHWSAPPCTGCDAWIPAMPKPHPNGSYQGRRLPDVWRPSYRK